MGQNAKEMVAKVRNKLVPVRIWLEEHKPGEDRPEDERAAHKDACEGLQAALSTLDRLVGKL